MIEALEKANGPSRELDEAIAITVLGMSKRNRLAEYPDVDPVWEIRDGKTYGSPAVMIDRFTASVDDALRLLNQKFPGWRICFEAVDGIAYDLFILGPLYRDDYPERESSPPIAGKPIAMALVLAAIKALQARGDA
ncbi:hypothetical protein HLI01_22455 [Rhizobium laguerreae]|uniref:hypothetical protein n=1 Tax=Rhizobium laguerreae TaxID=1076926 RepID=UPI00147882F9|nr:hypothetical protein [Rhizobium laguerreae]NNH59500.1 hypothetical protein [Rhizobium laguerreae]